MAKEMVRVFQCSIAKDLEKTINAWLEEKGQSIDITRVTSCGDSPKMVIIFYKYAHV